MKKIVFILIALLGGTLQAAHSKVSVIVPCSYKHAEHLYLLLKLCERQTMVPDEVVISLSEADKVDALILQRIRNERWQFPLILLTSNNKQYAGTNRNIASERATGHILIYQDSDDLPHPQRFEIIRYFFENYSIDHLLHEFVSSEELKQFPWLDARNIPFSYEKNLDAAWKRNPMLHNGCPTIRKKVLAKVKWPDTAHQEDTTFNGKVYRECKHCMFIKAPLYVYRIELSTWKNNPNLLKDKHWLDLYDDFYAHR